MAVVKMTRYTPFPEGVYNLQVVKYEEKDSQQQEGQKYYIWTIRILDPLPEEFTQDTFSVLTPTHLTEKNALRKFFTKVGFGAIEVGQEVNLDTLIAHRFVAKVAIKTLKNGNQANELGDITIPEYNAFLETQQQPQTVMPQAPRPAAPVHAAAAQTAVPRVAQPLRPAAPVARPATVAPATVAAPAARPAAPVAPRAPRPAAAPPPPVVQPPVAEEEQPVAEGADQLFTDDGSNDGTADFPSQA